MQYLTRLAVLGVLAPFASTAPVPKPKAGEEPPFACTISAPETITLGGAPAIKVAIANRTDGDVYLIGSLDASDCKWRLPYCTFEVTGPDGKSALTGFKRCGNMNPLREKDFVKVPAGGKFDPYQQIDDGGFFPNFQIRPEAFAAEGEYRVKFVYSTVAENGTKGDDFPTNDEKLNALLKQVPRVKLTSNELTVTVTPKK